MSLDGKRYIHQSFQIALDEIIFLQFLTGNGIITGMKRLDDLQLLVHQMTTEADSRHTGIIEYVAIDLILVDALGQELADDVIDVRTRRIISKSTGIGHHAAVNAGSPGLVQLREAAQLPYQPEHQLAGTAGMWLGNHQLSLQIRSQMMVYYNALRLAVSKYMIHFIKTSCAAKVNTEHEISLIKYLLHLLGMLIISYYVNTTRQPGNTIRYHIRYTNHWLLA